MAGPLYNSQPLLEALNMPIRAFGSDNQVNGDLLDKLQWEGIECYGAQIEKPAAAQVEAARPESVVIAPSAPDMPGLG